MYNAGLYTSDNCASKLSAVLVCVMVVMLGIIECLMQVDMHQTIVQLGCMLCWLWSVGIIECIMQGAARLITSCLFPG